MKRELLRLENIVKKEENLVVLSGLSFNLFADETLGLICDSLFEKQGLMDFLSGDSYESGRVYLNDRRLDAEEQSVAFKEQIAIIDRRKTLSRNLTVAENMFVISRYFKKNIIPKNRIQKRTENLLNKFDINIDANEYVRKLSALEYTIVEIIKAYAKGSRLIVLSDLTSFLSTVEIESIYKLVQKLKKNGITILIVDDYEDVLFRFSDRLMVMHNGKNIRTLLKDEFSREVISTLLMENVLENTGKIGICDQDEDVLIFRDICTDQLHEANITVCKGEKVGTYGQDEDVLVFRDVCTDHLHEANITVCKGELVNILCMDQNSYLDIIKLMQGELRPESGEILIDQKRYSPKNHMEAIEEGVCFICENPISNMLFYDMSVLDNLCFSMAHRLKTIWMKKAYRRNIAKSYDNILDGMVYRKSLEELSPETLQKLVYSKWYLYNPKIVVCMRPFTSVGLHLRKVTQDLIHDYAQKGIAVLIITSNITEAYSIGNKVVVLEKGKVIGEDKMGSMASLF